MDQTRNIKTAIYEVLAFFDLFDYPLTDLEIYRFASEAFDFAEISGALKSGGVSGLARRQGFNFLSGREAIIDSRSARYNIADRKYKRAVRIARLFKYIPWTKLVAVGNVIGANNTRDNGDIDIFIVTDRGRLWVTRLFAVALVKLLGLRPEAGNMKDKICLSFFMADNNLDLKRFMLFPLGVSAGNHNYRLQETDVYLVFWLALLVPVFDRDSVYSELIRQNSWLGDFFPNWRPVVSGARRDAGLPPSIFYRQVMNMLFGWTENLCKAFELKMLNPELRMLMNKDTRVVINDDVLKLFANDRRVYYQKKFLERLKTISDNVC